FDILWVCPAGATAEQLQLATQVPGLHAGQTRRLDALAAHAVGTVAGKAEAVIDRFMRFGRYDIERHETQRKGYNCGKGSEQHTSILLRVVEKGLPCGAAPSGQTNLQWGIKDPSGNGRTRMRHWD